MLDLSATNGARDGFAGIYTLQIRITVCTDKITCATAFILIMDIITVIYKLLYITHIRYYMYTRTAISSHGEVIRGTRMGATNR